MVNHHLGLLRGAVAWTAGRRLARPKGRHSVNHRVLWSRLWFPRGESPHQRDARVLMEIIVLGLSHKTAPIEIREKLYVPESELPEILEEIGGCGQILERLFLSTCNRVEAYAVVEDVEGARQCGILSLNLRAERTKHKNNNPPLKY